jgi:plastocyanin
MRLQNNGRNDVSAIRNNLRKEGAMHKIITLVALASFVWGCQHGTTTVVPQTSRTANVHNVKVGLNEVSPAEITVGVGDEILFFNDRTQPVTVILIEGGRSIACQRGFAGLVDQEAMINPGGTASFCFERAGTFKYMVRSKGVIEGAESVLPGQVIVKAGPAAPIGASASMAIPETSRTARVQDVHVGLTDVAPTETSVDVGDELRFINDRADPVRIILIDAGKSIACKRGFTGAVDQQADINPGESASFCFEKPGTAKYMVRSKPHGMVGGEKVVSAEVQIREASAESVKTKDNMRPSSTGTELSRTPKE